MIVNCYNCESSESSHFLSENGFDLVKCGSCGLLYVRDRPDDDAIDHATVVGLHTGVKSLHVDVYYNRSVIPRYRKVLKDIYGNDFGDVVSWLDVGCGHGEFMETLLEASQGKIDIAGSEPNLAKRQSATSRGLNVSYVDLAQGNPTYDAASLLNVYSHLADPVQLIRSIRGVLRPGAEFLIQTGDVANLSPDEIPRPLCLPDHLSFASEKILTDVLCRTGFEIVSVHRYPTFPFTISQVCKELLKVVLPSKTSYIR